MSQGAERTSGAVARLLPHCRETTVCRHSRRRRCRTLGRHVENWRRQSTSANHPPPLLSTHAARVRAGVHRRAEPRPPARRAAPRRRRPRRRAPRPGLRRQGQPPPARPAPAPPPRRRHPRHHPPRPFWPVRAAPGHPRRRAARPRRRAEGPRAGHRHHHRRRPRHVRDAVGPRRAPTPADRRQHPRRPRRRRARGRTGGRRPKLTPPRPATPSSSTTDGSTPCSRSPTCSRCPAPPSTATSTRPAPAVEPYQPRHRPRSTGSRDRHPRGQSWTNRTARSSANRTLWPRSPDRARTCGSPRPTGRGRRSCPTLSRSHCAGPPNASSLLSDRPVVQPGTLPRPARAAWQWVGHGTW